jgi:type III secretion protein D
MKTMVMKNMASVLGVSERFNTLLRQPKVLIAPKAARPCAMHITQGLHLGAELRLHKSPQRIGSAQDNDIILRDPGVLAHHAQLRRVDGVWDVFLEDAVAALKPAKHLRRGRCLRNLYHIGNARLVVSQPTAKPVFSMNSPPWLSRMIVPGLFVIAGLLIAGVMVQLVQPASAKMTAGSRSLANEGWPDVRVLTDSQRNINVEGHVTDAPQLLKLKSWLTTQDLEQANVTVRVGSELVKRVREALIDDTLTVSYAASGIIRIEGSTENLQVREQLRRLSQDLGGVVQLDDRVAYIERPEPPKKKALPFRIVDTIPGENGSFGTDTGARYFIGAVLPDGAEVIAIHADGVEFKLNEKNIIFPLK